LRTFDVCDIDPGKPGQRRSWIDQPFLHQVDGNADGGQRRA
jgi:hypothetical protein